MFNNTYLTDKRYDFECSGNSEHYVVDLKRKNKDGTQTIIKEQYQNYFTIYPDELKPNHEYLLSCNSENGQVMLDMRTHYFEEDFEFKTTVVSGKAHILPYTDKVRLIVEKAETGFSHNKTLKCEFGYTNEFGSVTIQDSGVYNEVYSSAPQLVETVLPLNGDEEWIEVWCKCKDSNGLEKVKYQKIHLDIHPANGSI